jgi:acylphosphatase
MARVAVSVTVAGRVQGVGFRAFVARHAAAWGLDGWVRNRSDGSVEILAIGEQTEIDELIRRCRKGPRMAEVVNLAVRKAEDDGTAGFGQRPTV